MRVNMEWFRGDRGGLFLRDHLCFWLLRELTGKIHLIISSTTLVDGILVIVIISISVAFTGTPLFVIAAIWFVGFSLSLLLHCRYYGYSRTVYALSLIFLTLFTIAAIIGCVVLYTGQGKFHTSTSNTLDYVVWQANTTVESLGSVLDYLEAAKHIRADQLFLPPDVQNNINKVETDINTATTALEHEARRN
ncbi:unnamed protein product [Camellia sinensis]